MAQKFVIYRRAGEWESGIRFGDVLYHRDLLKDKEGCMGGGAYVINEKMKKVICYGDSFDFGKPYFETLKYIPDEYKGWKLVYSPELNCPEKDRDNIADLSDEELEYIKDE